MEFPTSLKQQKKVDKALLKRLEMIQRLYILKINQNLLFQSYLQIKKSKDSQPNDKLISETAKLVLKDY